MRGKGGEGWHTKALGKEEEEEVAVRTAVPVSELSYIFEERMKLQNPVPSGDCAVCRTPHRPYQDARFYLRTCSSKLKLEGVVDLARVSTRDRFSHRPLLAIELMAEL